MNKNVVLNIKSELHKIAILAENIDYYAEKILEEPLKKVLRFKPKACSDVIHQFTSRVRDILYLINLNYKSNDELQFTHYLNVDAAYILLRGMVESTVLLNLFAGASDDISLGYLAQDSLDKANIEELNSGCSKLLGDIASKDNEYKRYRWAEPLTSDKNVSLMKLIDLCFIHETSKEELKYQVNHMNMHSHPHLTNDSRTIDSLFGSGHVDTIVYIIEMITTQLFSCVNSLHHLDLVYNGEQFYIELEDIISRLPDLHYINTLLNKSNENSLQNIIDWDFPFLDFRLQTYDLDISIADHIYDVLSLGGVTVGSDKDDYPRRSRCLDKLLYSFADHMREFIISFEEKKTNIFYTKIRFILEYFSIVYIVLHSDEERVEMYQTHADIKNYLSGTKLPKSFKEFARKRRKLIVEKMKKRDGSNYVSPETTYSNNLSVMKEYFEQKKVKMNKNKVKKDYAWAIGIIDDSKSAPSNLQLIQHYVAKYKSDRKLNNNFEDYISALYSLSCAYCHVTSYSITSKVWDQSNPKEDEIYYFILDMCYAMLQEVGNQFPRFREFLSITSSTHPELNIHNVFMRELEKYRKSVTIKLPNT